MGKYSESAMATCSSCLAGFYSAASASSCTACALATFQRSTGSSACETCVSGKFATTGAAVCSSCPLGTYAAESASACSSCRRGTYAGITGTGVVKLFHKRKLRKARKVPKPARPVHLAATRSRGCRHARTVPAALTRVKAAACAQVAAKFTHAFEAVLFIIWSFRLRNRALFCVGKPGLQQLSLRKIYGVCLFVDVHFLFVTLTASSNSDQLWSITTGISQVSPEHIQEPAPTHVLNVFLDRMLPGLGTLAVSRTNVITECYRFKIAATFQVQIVLREPSPESGQQLALRARPDISRSQL